MRIVVVGPTHPFKGGVAQHTTVLAHMLRAANHDVEVVSWRSQYPRLLYPGIQHVTGAPEIEPLPTTRRRLHWARPWTWVSEARRLRSADLVVLAHVTPVQVPVHWVLLCIGAPRDGRKAIICHNVLPHEPTALQRPLVTALLARGDVVVAHSAEQAALARELTRTPVVTVPLPPFGPASFAADGDRSGAVHRRLLFFGLVRPYKGLDILLRALARGPADVGLRVAGEFWGGVSVYEDLCRDLGIQDRVELIAGYVAADDVPALFGGVDALVLPYREATGSQGPLTAFECGVPVITTDAGALADRVTPGVDGLVVAADDVEALAGAIATFYSDDLALRLRGGVRRVDAASMWADYLDVLGVQS